MQARRRCAPQALTLHSSWLHSELECSTHLQAALQAVAGQLRRHILAAAAIRGLAALGVGACRLCGRREALSFRLEVQHTQRWHSQAGACRSAAPLSLLPLNWLLNPVLPLPAELRLLERCISAACPPACSQGVNRARAFGAAAAAAGAAAAGAAQFFELRKLPAFHNVLVAVTLHPDRPEGAGRATHPALGRRPQPAAAPALHCDQRRL